MNADTHRARIPDVLLERYALGEVSAAERAEIERGLHEDGALRARLEAIQRSEQQVQETGFAAALAERTRRRPPSRSGNGAALDQARVSAWRWAVPAAVGAAVILAVVIGSRAYGPRNDAEDGDRIKGHPFLTVFRQTPDGPETLADGAVAHPGDLVRLGYQAAGRQYGAIVSIDGRGTITEHLPANGGPAVRLQPGDMSLLDNAYELDDAPRWERFYFVTSQAPFDAGRVVEAARRDAARAPASPPARLALPVGLEQSTFTLQKEHRP